MRREIILLSLVFLLMGCCKGISVQNQYFSRDDLASHIVGTPDPDRNCPPIGQRLIVQWKFTQEMLQMENFHLEMTVRFRNYEEEKIIIPVRNTYGTYLYELANQRYFDSCGIATYKIETWGCGELLDTWKHQLWVELITLDQENDQNTTEYNPDAIDFID